MVLEVVIEDARWAGAGLETIGAEALAAVLARRGLTAADATLLAASDARVARLNADFRGKPAPTNVLSWPSRDLGPPEPGAPPPLPRPDATGDLYLGDIALAWETCAREAAAAGRPISAHATHLVVHAILHLLGYDHIFDQDADLMERLEVEILSTLGVPDPYSTGADGRHGSGAD
ncbi:MAG: rRNA maturation RNase YbeY [Alphaproteobacteria bacterium]|jgi:probable rRNA maturation factor|nr:rRNA maturation RNase YbeY [Alphaproteobacteria bacterium]